MRVRLRVIATAAVGGLLLGACGTSQASAPPTDSATPDCDLDGAARDDADRREPSALWLPAHWQLSLGLCPYGSSGCTPTCPPGRGRHRVRHDDERVGRSSGAATRPASVWIVRRPLGTGPATSARLTYGHGSVAVSVPRLGVDLYGYGPIGARIAESFSDSTLERALLARLPVAVPHGWHRVRDGILSVAIPSAWPIHRLGGPHTVSPGACDFAFFPHPGAFTGFGTEVLLCPLITGGTDLLNHVTPANGVWLQTGAKTVGPFSCLRPDDHRRAPPPRARGPARRPPHPRGLELRLGRGSKGGEQRQPAPRARADAGHRRGDPQLHPALGRVAVPSDLVGPSCTPSCDSPVTVVDLSRCRGVSPPMAVVRGLAAL